MKEVIIDINKDYKLELYDTDSLYKKRLSSLIIYLKYILCETIPEIADKYDEIKDKIIYIFKKITGWNVFLVFDHTEQVSLSEFMSFDVNYRDIDNSEFIEYFLQTGRFYNQDDEDEVLYKIKFNLPGVSETRDVIVLVNNSRYFDLDHQLYMELFKYIYLPDKEKYTLLDKEPENEPIIPFTYGNWWRGHIPEYEIIPC